MAAKESRKVWNKEKALEAMKKLKGSGNGKLVDALLKERSIERMHERTHEKTQKE